MIKALLKNSDGPILVAGLEEENIARLKADFPIDIPLAAFGVDLPGRLVILYGRTAKEIERVLQQAGAIINTRHKGFSIDPIAEAHAKIASNESKILIATVGLPRSGKSTWARTQAYPIVCPDEIRTALHGHRFIAESEPFVWAICRVMIRSLFGAGHHFIILDACNSTRKRRDEWRTPEWSLCFKLFETDEQTCFDRAQKDGDSEICPIIASMAAKFETLDPDEEPFY